jgi:hypothetical protein
MYRQLTFQIVSWFCNRQLILKSPTDFEIASWFSIVSWFTIVSSSPSCHLYFDLYLQSNLPKERLAMLSTPHCGLEPPQSLVEQHLLQPSRCMSSWLQNVKPFWPMRSTLHTFCAMASVFLLFILNAESRKMLTGESVASASFGGLLVRPCNWWGLCYK